MAGYADTSHAIKLQRLLSYLEQDPSNLPLLADAVTAALQVQSIVIAAELLERYATLAPLPRPMRIQKGLVAIQSGRIEEARSVFEELLSETPNDPVLKFNLGWCASLQGDYQAADDFLDEPATAASPLGPTLKIQALHQLGVLDTAFAWGTILVAHHPDDRALAGALAAVALDAEDLTLAEYYAGRAGEEPDGLAARGFLMLNDNHLEEARALFDRALAARPADARALLGKGLVLLLERRVEESSGAIDRAAQLFGHHAGSWIAAGWVHLMAGSLAIARERFEQAAAIDDTFAEVHGGLAVLDVMSGDTMSAERRIEVALRLDRRCLSAALAKSMLLDARNEGEAARRVRELALNTPTGLSGRTLIQTISTFGFATRGTGSSQTQPT